MLHLRKALLLLASYLYFTFGLEAGQETALDDLFNANPSNSLGWNAATDYCTFPDQVVCDPTTTNVLEIEFNGINLQTIPTTFWNLPFLTNLTINNMPALTSAIPSEVSGLSSILDFRVTRTEMGGVLPPELGSLTTLKVLQLQSNNFEGAIPASFGGLVNMELLKLRDNFLNESLPSFFELWTNCHSLVLDDNLFTGIIPPQWANMPNLRIISVSDNSLSGGFPDSFENHPTLFAVYAFRCNLDGWLWNGWDTLQGVPRSGLIAVFHDNNLRGFIPSSFERIGAAQPPFPAYLQLLELAGNDWYCPIPDIRSWAYSTDYAVLQYDICSTAPTPDATPPPTAEPTPEITAGPTPNITPAPISRAPCVPLYDTVIGCDGVRFTNFREPDPDNCPDPEEWCVRWFISPSEAPGDARDTCVPHDGSDTPIYVGPANDFEMIVAQAFGQNSFEEGHLSDLFESLYAPDSNNLRCWFTPGPTPVPTPVPTPAPTNSSCAEIPGWFSNAMATSFPPHIITDMSGFISGTNTLQIALNISTKYVDAQIGYEQNVCPDECLDFLEYSNDRGDAYWVITEDVMCWQTFVLSIPWPNLYELDINDDDQGVGNLVRTVLTDEITFEGKLFVQLREWLGYIDGSPMTRAVESELNYIIVFPTHIEAQLINPVRVFYDVVSLSAVIDQIIVSTGNAVVADVTLITSVQWPFRLENTPATGVTITSINNGMVATAVLKQDCDEPLGVSFDDGVQNQNACKQHWTITVDPGVGNCDIDGDYELSFYPECQPGMANDCPLELDDEALEIVVEDREIITVAFSLISEDFCAQVIEEVDLVADLVSFRDTQHTWPADDFFMDRTVYFAVEVVSAFATISQTTLRQITLEQNIDGTITTWPLMELNGAQASADGVSFSLVFDNNPVLQPGDPMQSQFSITLDSGILDVPFDWSSNVWVMVQLDVDYSGVTLLEEKSLRRRELLALPSNRLMSIRNSFKLIPLKNSENGESPLTNMDKPAKSSATQHFFNIFIYLVFFLVCVVI